MNRNKGDVQDVVNLQSINANTGAMELTVEIGSSRSLSKQLV